jgi:hypothetical protein
MENRSPNEVSNSDAPRNLPRRLHVRAIVGLLIGRLLMGLPVPFVDLCIVGSDLLPRESARWSACQSAADDRAGERDSFPCAIECH